MTVRVIGRLATEDDKPKQALCKCGALLEYTARDVLTEVRDQSNSPYVACPSCNAQVWLRPRGRVQPPEWWGR